MLSITKEELWEAIDSQPELVGETFTDRVWVTLIQLLDKAKKEANK